MGVRSACLSLVASLAAALVASFALAACGAGADSGGEPGGFGGGATSTTTSTTSSGSTSTGTGGSGEGGGGIGGSVDCLAMCGAESPPAAVDLYGALATCVFCDQCYVDCPAPPTAVTCTDPPTGTVCEQGDCQLCAQCALDGACANARDACQSDAVCVAYGNWLAVCSKK